jgi:hypothetical protein
MQQKAILAIGGAVIKTARPQLINFIAAGNVEILIHNGGSLFHDFQIAALPEFQNPHAPNSFPLNLILQDYKKYTHQTSLEINAWIAGNKLAPQKSATALCEKMGIPVLLFTGLATDFWQLPLLTYHSLADFIQECFQLLCKRMRSGPFYYLLMGSAVIHPEVFAKAIAVAKPQNFKADVVDFNDHYRPRTRVARYGKYYLMTHKEFLHQQLYPLSVRPPLDITKTQNLIQGLFKDPKETLTMDIISFLMPILTLRTRWQFSVTSWGRTVQHNTNVGGVPGSDHLLWLGIDIVLEPQEKNLAFEKDCSTLGLSALYEITHYHLRPTGKI